MMNAKDEINNVTIRTCEPRDREALRQICCETAYLGDHCHGFFPDQELLADLVMAYHTDFEPQHTWVAEYQGKIIGYLCACYDPKLYTKAMITSIVPKALLKAIFRGKIFVKKTTYRLLWYSLRVAVQRQAKLKASDPRQFPVHIHQNMQSGFRGQGIGRKLVEAFLQHARDNNVKGIKFRALRRQPTFPFFERFGFKLIDCQRVPLWEQWLGQQPLYFMEYARKLV